VQQNLQAKNRLERNFFGDGHHAAPWRVCHFEKVRPGCGAKRVRRKQESGEQGMSRQKKGLDKCAVVQYILS
jgi:hypothetical protein